MRWNVHVHRRRGDFQRIIWEVGLYDFANELSGKYEQGIEQGNKQSALRMIKAGKLSPEEIAMYSDLTLEQVIELEKDFHQV